MAKTRVPDDDLGQPIPYDPDFNGPLKRRSCTDVICLMLFLLFIGCWAGIAIYAYSSGDPYTLLVPKDSQGGRCGLDEHLKDKPYLFFFDLTKCLGPAVPFTGCPTTQVCVEKCPTEFFSNDDSHEYSKLICNYDKNPTSISEGDQMVYNGDCARWYLPSSSLLNRCLYNVADRKSLKGDVGRQKGDEISEFKRHLNKFAMWLSLFVQKMIGYFTDKEQAQQVLSICNTRFTFRVTHVTFQNFVLTNSILNFPQNFAPTLTLVLFTVEKRCIPNINRDSFEKIKDKINSTYTYDNILSSVKNLKALSTAEEVGQNVVDDLISSWWKILIGVGVAVLVCIIYIMMLRWLATPMVWLSLIGVVALLVAAVYFTTVKYIDLRDNPVKDDEDRNLFQSYATKKDTWLVLLIIACVVLALVLIILIFLRKRIVLAIALVKEGSKAVSSVTSVLFFPIFPWLLQIGVTAFAITVALYLATTGEPQYKVRYKPDGCTCTTHQNGDICDPAAFHEEIKNCVSMDSCQNLTCKFITMDNPSLYPYLQAFNVIGFLWGTFFVSALGQMILASVFATWYWTFNKANLPFFAVLEATGRVLRYHIGTLAFGSLIITICRMIRIALEYIDHKLKKYDNGLTKAILCCCKCFFWCLENFLKFLNRNAYIMCAIHGKNFCTSAKDAFMLLMRNILRVFVLDKVTDFLFFLGKLLITIGVGAIAYVFFATDLTGIDNSGLNYNIVPVIVIMIITFFIATMFFNVYSMAVDTLFLCFLEDCERNDGSSQKPYYMSRSLMKIFGKKNKMD